MKLSLAPLAVAFALASMAGCAAETGAPDDEAQTEDELRSYAMADGEHPEVGMLYFKEGRSYCTATAVGRRTIITAAHCAIPVPGAAAGTTCKGEFRLDPSGAGGSRAPWTKFPFHTCARRRVPGEIPGERDLAIIHLDADLPAALVPARVPSVYPKEGTRTIYGYGRFGRRCAEAGDDHKRKAEVSLQRSIFATATCPGDSGGPHFLTGTRDIIGITSGDLLVQVTAAPVAYASWVNARIAESEASRAFTGDAVLGN